MTADPAPGTVADCAERWIATLGDAVTLRTWADYRLILDRHVLPRFGDLAPADVGPATISRWYEELRAAGAKDGGELAIKTIERVHTVVRAVFAAACADGLVTADPAAGATLPKADAPPDEDPPLSVWTDAQARRFLRTTATEPFGPLWGVLLGTGMRLFELRGLRWDDVDLGGARVHVRQTLAIVAARVEVRPARASRTIALDARTAAALAARRARQDTDRAERGPAWCNEHGFVFTDRSGEPLRDSTIRARLRSACEAAGVPAISAVDLRDTHAALLLGAGVPLPLVAARLGHATLGAARLRYGQLVPATDADAAARLAAVLRGGG